MTKTNKLEYRKSIKKIIYSKCSFLRMINEIGKSLARLSRKKREKTQITDITNDGCNRILNCNVNELKNLDEMNIFLKNTK